jgi:hypothetical protein
MEMKKVKERKRNTRKKIKNYHFFLFFFIFIFFIFIIAAGSVLQPRSWVPRACQPSSQNAPITSATRSAARIVR